MEVPVVPKSIGLFSKLARPLFGLLSLKLFFLGAGVECEIGLVVKTGVGEMKRARCSFGLKTTLLATGRQHGGWREEIKTDGVAFN